MNCMEITSDKHLAITARPLPHLGAGEVLIQVKAAGVNRPDVLQRQGLYPAPPGASDIPGLEVAGTVVARATDVTTPNIGDSVCALLSGGGYAEYASASARCCLPWPRGLDAVQAAALPETFFTVWHNVFERGALKSGEVFLVHGGASGIGTTAIQLAKAFGAFVITTAGSDEKRDACLKLGADIAINYRTQDFAAAVRGHAPGQGADVILDMVGGSYISRNIACLKRDGRLVNIAFQEGSRTEIDLMPVMLKRLTLTGSTLRIRDNTFKGALAEALNRKVWPLLAVGTVKPVIDRVFPLTQASDAHRHMEGGAHIGKIVLTAD